MARTRSAERIVSRLLGAGVIVSAACLLTGFGLTIFQAGESTLRPSSLDEIREAFQQSLPALIVDSNAWLYSGICLLMLTPCLRVVSTTIIFSRAREWRYVTLSILVLVTLIVSAVFSLLR